jgi:hypothetical protein
LVSISKKHHTISLLFFWIWPKSFKLVLTKPTVMKTFTLLLTSLIFTNLLPAQNVGIGTATPGARLEVVHQTGVGFRVQSTTGNSIFEIDAKNQEPVLLFKQNGTGAWKLRTEPGSNYLEFSHPLLVNPALLINPATGNVGIGVTWPQYKLDIETSGMNGFRLKSTTSAITFALDGANAASIVQFVNNGELQWNLGNLTNNDFYIFEVGNAQRLTIQNVSGFVGIGTSTPTAKLDVNGRTNTDQLQVGAGTVMSNIQSGSFAAGASADDFLTATLTFPTAFAAVPRVTATAPQCQQL